MLETTGIAEPGPLLEALTENPAHGRSVVACRVVTVVDAEAGLAVLERHAEARGQVITADRVLLSKLDWPRGPALPRLHDALAQLNPDAERASFPERGRAPPRWCRGCWVS